MPIDVQAGLGVGVEEADAAVHHHHRTDHQTRGGYRQQHRAQSEARSSRTRYVAVDGSPCLAPDPSVGASPGAANAEWSSS
jgi:hypothetical protein